MRRLLFGYSNCTFKNGIDKYLLNVINALKNEDVEIDLLTSCYSKEFEEEMKKFGVNLLTIDRLSHPIKRYKQVSKIVQNRKYFITYFNVSEAFNCICNIAVKKHSNAIVITHSHNSKNTSSNILKKNILLFAHIICKPLINKYSDYYYACSNVAGDWLFGKNKVANNSNYRIIRNTIDTHKFLFDFQERNKIRNMYGINNEYVIGFVGNFLEQKNPLFLIEIFDEIRKLHSNVKFFMIGDGHLRQEIENKIQDNNLCDYVILTGGIDNVSSYMSAMDALILPSFFEGLPIVGIEAQVNGLECFFSDSITQEIKISNLAHFISLKDESRLWAKEILSFLPNDRNKVIQFENVMVDSNKQKQEFIDIFVNDKFK